MIKLILISLLLVACSTTPVQKQHETIKNQIETIKKTLPEECKTDAVLSQIKTLESQVDTELVVCEDSIKDLENRNLALNGIILAIIIFVIFFRR